MGVTGCVTLIAGMGGAQVPACLHAWVAMATFQQSDLKVTTGPDGTEAAQNLNLAMIHRHQL